MSSRVTKGFTLIELLVVISVIGLLSSIVLASLTAAKEKAKVAQVVSQIHELRNAIGYYYDDTGIFPTGCLLNSCTAAQDPFVSSLGVPGWKGPYYIPLWNLKDPWGGHLTLGTADIDPATPGNENYITLDDDAPSSSDSNNQGIIPTSAMIAIDKILDDGDLTTGNVRGNAGPAVHDAWSQAIGEMSFVLRN